MPYARLASGWRLALAGWESNPLDFIEGFPFLTSLSPFPGLAWRDPWLPPEVPITAPFGTYTSQVQILSPRPMISTSWVGGKVRSTNLRSRKIHSKSRCAQMRLRAGTFHF